MVNLENKSNFTYTEVLFILKNIYAYTYACEQWPILKDHEFEKGQEGGTYGGGTLEEWHNLIILQSQKEMKEIKHTHNFSLLVKLQYIFPCPRNIFAEILVIQHECEKAHSSPGPRVVATSQLWWLHHLIVQSVSGGKYNRDYFSD